MHREMAHRRQLLAACTLLLGMALATVAITPATVVLAPEDYVMENGSSVLLTCIGHGEPLPSITWTRAATVLSNDSSWVSVYEELVDRNGKAFVRSALEVCSIEKTDNYSCTAENDYAADDVIFSLAVQDPVQILTQPDHRVDVDIATTVVFTCVASGTRVSSFTWRKDGLILTNSSDLRATIYENSTTNNGVDIVESFIEINNLEEDDSGTYSCSAENKVSFDTATFQLFIQDPSKILFYPDDTRVNASTTLVLSCVAKGIPTPDVTWIKNGTKLVNDSHITIYDVTNNTHINSFMEFCCLSDADNGTYGCIAENTAGSETVTFEVSVLPNLASLDEVTDEEEEERVGEASYTGGIICIAFLLTTVIAYLASRSLRSSSTGIFLINTCVSLIALYISYIISYHATSSEVVCRIFSGVFHYCFLVSALALAAMAVFRFWGTSQWKKSALSVTIALIWSVPLVIVVPSAGSANEHYIRDQNDFCTPAEEAYWFGLLFPWGIVHLLTWVALCIAPYVHIKGKALWLREHIGLVVVVLLHNVTWGIGLAPIHHPLADGGSVQVTLQSFFVILSVLLGLAVFTLFFLFSGEIRELVRRHKAVHSHISQRAKESVYSKAPHVVASSRPQATSMEDTTKAMGERDGQN